MVSTETGQIRVCSRCGRTLPPQSPISICVRCTLEEAAAEVGPTTVDDLGLEDLAPDYPELGQADGPGHRIGRYKLLEKVGEGGYGAVYVAEQQEPIHRRVALKVIKLGMDTRAVVARFEAERQALAMMDHPNIAKVLDAGATESGRPYFVMELVRGIKITEYCDQANLSTKERLHLFIQICQAIQHAHQKGIIHRDIKPSNILVTLHDGVPVPKVIDFGIAKATEGRLTDKTVYTQLHQFVGTPAYMSPEQAEMSGLDIDTRSDIYSLGVLLYELLIGRPPFDPRELMAAGLDVMRRTIREKEPARPSTRLASMPGEELTTTAKRRSVDAPKLIHLVKGDLDWIVMRCLEKDRTRRYETATSVAHDVQRHLDHEPVTARPPSAAYRFQKMVQRNRRAFVGTVVVAMALILGFSAAMVGFVQAVRAKAKEAELRKRAQAQELVSHRRAYAAEMNTAFHALEENNLDHVLQLLDRQRPKPGEEDLRGFEWRCLWQRTRGTELISWPGESKDTAAYSPDGRFLVYGCKEIVVRDAKTKSLIIKLPAAANSLSFSPDSSLLVSGDSEHALVWDTLNWKQVRSLPGAHLPVRFSPNGQWLLTGTLDGYRLWTTDSWKPAGLASGASSWIGFAKEVVAFSPDSRHLLTAASGSFLEAHQIRVWRVPAMQEMAPIETGDETPITVTFSAEGARVIAGTYLGKVMVWDFERRTIVKTWNAHACIGSVGVTPDGKWLITSGADHAIRSWDLATFEPVSQIGVQTGSSLQFAISPDGREVLSGSVFPPETKVWSTSSGNTAPVVKGDDSVLGFLDHGRLLVGNTTNDLAIWDPADGSQVHLPIFGAIEVQDYNFLYAIKPDNATIAVGRSDGTIESWSLTSRTKESTWQAHQDGVRTLAFSPDGRTIASGSKRGLIKLWDFGSHTELSHLDLVGTKINCFSFSPDGRLLAGATESGLVVWNIASRKEILRSDCGGDQANMVVFSPDGKLLAVTAQHSCEVHLWDPNSGTHVAVLKGLIGEAAWLTFSPDGRTLASSGWRAKFWQVPSFLEVGSIGEGDYLYSLAFSPDGRALAFSYGRHNKHVSLWRAPSLEEIDRIESRK